MSDVKNILVARYLPYAKETIINRAIPYIDGFKPVQRKVLYGMMELGLLKGGKKKSARIVGDVMGKYHPHGDSSIYDSMCNMSAGYDNFNAPLVLGQGNLGKTWSDDKLGGIQPAKMRYSEAGLTALAAELFDGINDGAVEMVPNYDGTEKEPLILPTKFPNVLVNANSGVAVGMSSYVPTYTLRNACLAVASILRGKSKTAEDIVEILGAPDFPIGGTIHCNKELLMKLLNTGRATFTMTGNMHRQGDDIVIDSVPAGVTFERVSAQLAELAQTPDGREIVDILSNVGLNSAGILVKVKKNADLRSLALKIYQKTSVRANVSFLSQIIWEDEPLELGTFELIEKWIDFRSECVERVYTRRAQKLEEEEHKKSAWSLIYNDIAEVVGIMSAKTEDEARVEVGSRWGLDEAQLDYLFDLKIKTICKDKADKELEALDKLRNNLVGVKLIRDDKTARYNLMASELEEIAEKYGTAPCCKRDDLVPEEEKVRQKAVVPDTMSTVFITKRGFIKCIHNVLSKEEVKKYMTEDDEFLVPPVYMKLNDTLLLYTYGGYCYKVPVVDVESSKTGFKQYFWDLVDRKDNAPLLFACAAKDYDDQFVLVYGHGRGRIVFTRDVAGKNRVYKNAFLPGNNIVGSKDRIFIVPFKKFYMITKNGKAAYGNVTDICAISTRVAFKVARTPDNDPVMWFLDATKFDETGVDGARYCKGYCVKAVEENLVKAIEEFKPEGC